MYNMFIHTLISHTCVQLGTKVPCQRGGFGLVDRVGTHRDAQRDGVCFHTCAHVSCCCNIHVQRIPGGSQGIPPCCRCHDVLLARNNSPLRVRGDARPQDVGVARGGGALRRVRGIDYASRHAWVSQHHDARYWKGWHKYPVVQWNTTLAPPTSISIGSIRYIWEFLRGSSVVKISTLSCSIVICRKIIGKYAWLWATQSLSTKNSHSKCSKSTQLALHNISQSAMDKLWWIRGVPFHTLPWDIPTIPWCFGTPTRKLHNDLLASIVNDIRILS